MFNLAVLPKHHTKLIINANVRKGMKMKITEMKIYPISIPLEKPFKIALGTSYEYKGVLVKLETDQGIYGWGEAAPSDSITGETQGTVMAVLEERIRQLIIGSEVLEVEELLNKVDGAVLHNPSAKAAIDIAIHDIIGKVSVLPIRNLIGGHKEEIDTSLTIGIESKEESVKRAQELVEEGAKVIKVKIGLDWKEDVERVKAIRDVVGYDVRLRLDANQGYSVKEAINALSAMERYEIEFCEQPVHHSDILGMAKVRANIGIPIMADESVHSIRDAVRIIKEEAADMINIKLMKAGGIRAGMKIASIAEAAGMPCMVGCMVETKVGITAGTHLALGMKNVKYADLDGHIDLKHDVTKGGVMTKEGVNRLSRGAGLGLDVVEEKVLL